MLKNEVTRREFVRDTAAKAAGFSAAASTARIVAAGNPTKADTSKILTRRRCL